MGFVFSIANQYLEVDHKKENIKALQQCITRTKNNSHCSLCTVGVMNDFRSRIRNLM